MKLKKLFLAGVTKIFLPEKIFQPKKTVAQALQSDWLKIGKDFRKVINSYGRA